MALLAPLIAFIGRQLGRLVQMVFGWATLMLFGRVPQSKQLLLAGVSAGALVWIVVLVGVAIPDIGTFLIGFIPSPDFIREDWIRLAMLILAVVLPLAIGAGGLMLMDPDDRPEGIGGKVLQVLRGYPYAAVLAIVILFLLVVAPIFKLRTIVKHWEDAHVPIIVKPDGYEQVAAELEQAVDSAGLNLQRERAPRVLEAPSRLLAMVGGESVRRLVPDRLVMLKAPSLEVTIHPSDVAVVGSKEAVARARAAVADRLTKTEAYLTVAEEAQEIEDELRGLRGIDVTDAAAHAEAFERLKSIDARLARLVVPYEEWEVLYRQRLQVERDLLRVEADLRHDEQEGPNGILDRVGRAVDVLVSR
jgi:hypothetical protein